MSRPVTTNYLSHYGHFANAAYHRFESWSDCAPCQEFDDIAQFNLTAAWSTTTMPAFSRGFVGVHSQRQEVVVVYRGTTHPMDVLADSQVIQPRYMASREIMKDALGKLVMEYPTYDVHFVGHSLGGAQATLAFLEAVSDTSSFGDIRLVTFGAPRVGNAVFAQYANAQLSSKHSALRVTHESDIIPHLPSSLLPKHYMHSDQETPSALPAHSRCSGTCTTTCTIPGLALTVPEYIRQSE
ncbi:alpha/beta-hydrolase [Linderina pennispora]|uniref:Alpha/beta-hydrolase n=1 Tax=Linderina pennispora TaxID=61395 RepID=A0A1Y1VYT3_9FUNG|nr:alpha/beta-hydrolase [Linderina pennispora]ORX66420.1 alpha/beta-hydrolase [Linderina pennispora]